MIPKFPFSLIEKVMKWVEIEVNSIILNTKCLWVVEFTFHVALNQPLGKYDGP